MTARTPQVDESRDDRITDRDGHIICAREDSATKVTGVPNGDDDASSEDRARDDESVRDGEKTPPPPPPPMILRGDGHGDADADADAKSSKENTVWAGAVRLVSGIDGVVPRRILYGASVTALVLLQVSFIVDHVMGPRISSKSHGVA